MNSEALGVLYFAVFAAIVFLCATALPMWVHYRRVKKEFMAGKLTQAEFSLKLWNG